MATNAKWGVFYIRGVAECPSPSPPPPHTLVLSSAQRKSEDPPGQVHGQVIHPHPAWLLG